MRSMPTLALIPAEMLNLAYALAAGLLIGLQRGWMAREEVDGGRIAGFRTFGLLGLTGGVAGLLPALVGGALAGGIALLLAIGYWRQSQRAIGMSATNAVVALLTLGLGMIATLGRPTEAIGIAAIVTMLLAMRDPLHRWLRGVSPAEMRAAARFALIALVILPLAPDQPMGPLGAWNPHKLWLVVVLVSGLSFAGYVASRRAQPGQSVLITALCGAIVSSTAVPAACARRLAAEDGQAAALRTAIILASVVMYARVLVLTALMAPEAAFHLALIVLPALVVLAIPSIVGLREAATAHGDVEIKLGNPLELGIAFGLAALVAVMMLISQWALDAFGHLGLAAVLILTGFADVDAAVMTLAAAEPGAIAARVAGMVLAGPVIINTLLKAGLSAVLAGNREGGRAAAWLGASAAASGLALLLLA